MRKSVLVGVVASIASVAWLFAGCYTTLKHPVLRPSLEDEKRVRVSYADDCWACHSSRSETFWIEETPPAAAGYYAWDYFYSTPWWLDATYYYGQGTGGGSEELPQPRGFRRRGEPASTPGAPALQQPSPTLRGVSRKASGESEPAETKVEPAQPDDRRPVSRRESGSETKEERRRKKP